MEPNELLDEQNENEEIKPDEAEEVVGGGGNYGDGNGDGS